jgi:uncharacterized repeat protein (TIGR02543 family)
VKTTPASSKHLSTGRLGIFFIALAFVVVMVGCGEQLNPPAWYSLTMAVAPGGGGMATDLTNTSPYAAGTAVSIKAVAAAGYRFVSWTAPAGGFVSATAATTAFTMPAQDTTVTANFAPFAGGSGTAMDPYQITDWYQLDNIRNYLDSYFILVNDLDATTAGHGELASETANQGEGWEPIGTWGDGFAEMFDGQGYEISDVFIDRPTENLAGLFGVVDGGGVIKNIGVVNATVTGWFDVGGLVAENAGSVSNSYSTGNVTGSEFVGGLVAVNTGSVSNSYSTGNVTGLERYFGGLVAANTGNVTNSYFSGSVVGGSYEGDSIAGGLVGHNAFGAVVAESYSSGSVTGERWVGGLVAMNTGTVSNSYSSGNVIGSENVGGLVGGNGGTVSDSFWDTQTSGQATSDGGTGKTTAQMQDITTFSGAAWDIAAVADPNTRNASYIWNIVDDETYPFLSWQFVA